MVADSVEFLEDFDDILATTFGHQNLPLFWKVMQHPGENSIIFRAWLIIIVLELKTDSASSDLWVSWSNRFGSPAFC